MTSCLDFLDGIRLIEEQMGSEISSKICLTCNIRIQNEISLVRGKIWDKIPEFFAVS